ncbi:uracil-DNA glycosylase family protein [Algoriphagus aquimarinus]|uniref:G:T/U-mismatch repair DNA glycosylase n=1 Tax=Algoriphagus aquimarinus TaxID=237018 RepID=A0A1I0Y1P3_9BACT|nr:uracil-DNA glycosylase family protein [Algoriphagus aquimarinus]SFB07084.1 G:T/U-mismatch repair DNA glycosylase [Algoriphagus aquimarinus]
MNSIHPYIPFIPAGATRLIIGTIPPARFCNQSSKKLYDTDVDFYYGSKDNAFWGLIGEVFCEHLERSNTTKAIEKRKSLLAAHGIGITDIISECSRENQSASDDKLDVISRKDLSILLIEHPSITTLIYTSEFVKIEVNKHFKSFHHIDKENKKKQSLKIDGKMYQVRILYSPSPSGLRNLGVDGLNKRLNQYKDFLFAD